MKRASILVSIAFIAAAAMFASLTRAQDVNVTGTWNMTVETQAGSGSPTFTLKQDKETLTGTYKGQLGEANVKGTIKGKEIKITFKVNVQDMDLECEYTGTVDGDTMKGKVKLGELGEGTFTGKKQ